MLNTNFFIKNMILNIPIFLSIYKCQSSRSDLETPFNKSLAISKLFLVILVITL